MLVVALVLFAELWTEVMWFRELDFLGVLQTRIIAQVALFLIGSVIMATAVYGSLTIAYRTRPVYAPATPGQETLDRYREQLEPLRRLVAIAVPAVLGLFAGSAAAGQWSTVLLWLNRQEFGTEDAQFGLDNGFYVFTLPFYEFLVGFGTAVLLLSGVAAVVTHYLYGGLRISGTGDRTTRAARLHLGLLGSAFLLLRALGYWLERYATLTEESELIAGPGYTVVNAVIPARTVLAVVAVLVALAFLYTAFRGNWRIPGVAVALLILTAVLAGGVWPQVIQRFQVQPNALALETRFIERNIEATRAAYDLEDLEIIDYDAELTGERGALTQDARTIPGIRLIDPNVVAPTFQQRQQIRQFYAFPESLDVSRYNIDGETRDTVISVRDVNLAGLPPGQRNWVNDHTVYTHGFGVVAAFGNQRTAGGEPVFFQSGIPSRGDLGEFEPRIYYGEFSPEYSIVGAPEGAAPQELDFPDNNAPNGQQNYTYTGTGGVPMGDFIGRLLFAIKFRAEEIFLSDTVNSESVIMFDREPRDRIEKVAPWLQLDGDPYPAVVDGRVVWIVDGYTTSGAYPYASSTVLDEATQTAVTATAENVATLLPDRVNYVRNSVKATVDAYTGEVTLYAWDEDDPLLQAWSEVFPGSLSPVSEMSGELMSHVRYPQGLFNVQREVLERYHITDPAAFFSGQDYWSVPNDPTVSSISVDQPPYYLSLRMPGQDAPTFSLTSTYIPTTRGDVEQRNVLTGFLAADGDAGDVAGEPSDGYGQLRLLQLRNDEAVSGPGQVQNDFDANPEISQDLNVLRLGESDTISGNLLTLPIGGGLLYVQPVYVQSQGETSFPLLQRVLVAFGNEIAFGETLGEALDQIFDGDAGADTPDAQDPAGDDSAPPEDGDSGEEPTGAAAAEARLDEALQDARRALLDGEQALAQGDFASYGEAQERLADAIERALVAEAELTGDPVPEGDITLSPGSEASPSPEPTDASTDG